MHPQPRHIDCPRAVIRQDTGIAHAIEFLWQIAPILLVKHNLGWLPGQASIETAVKGDVYIPLQITRMLVTRIVDGQKSLFLGNGNPRDS